MKLVLRTFAWLAVLPYVGVLVIVLTSHASWSAIAYLAAFGVCLYGLATLPRDPEGEVDDGTPSRRRGVSRAGLLAIGIVGIVRCATARDGHTLHVETSSGRGSRLAARLVDEGDVAVAATRLLVLGRMLQDDALELPGAMRAGYTKMRAAEGDVPSPLVSTCLGAQRPSAFDLVIVDPPNETPRSAVVFLHGFAGNFDLPCWQMAQTVAPLGMLTACPSTRWVGDWETPAGEAAVRRTTELLRARGIDTFVLAGLSNGGIGASELAPRMRGTFSALVLISGAEGDADSAGVPTLVIHGRYDSMASRPHALQYAEKNGARFVDVDAGHFAMLVRPDTFDIALRGFLRDVFSSRRAP